MSRSRAPIGIWNRPRSCCAASPRPRSRLTRMEGPMTDLAPHLTAFLQEHLPNERRFSRHTVQSYTECFRLLVVYAAEQIKVRPCALKIEHFTVALLLAFLESLEKVRNNSVGTRNIRLAAIKSFLPVRGIPCPELPRPCIAGARHPAEARRQAPDRLARPDRDASDPGCSGYRDGGRPARPRGCCTCAAPPGCGCRN